MDDRKLLTITVFCTTCKVLVQGNSCQDWLSSEFDAIKDMVHRIHKECIASKGTDKHQEAHVKLVKDLPLPVTFHIVVDAETEDIRKSPFKCKSTINLPPTPNMHEHSHNDIVIDIEADETKVKLIAFNQTLEDLNESKECPKTPINNIDLTSPSFTMKTPKSAVRDNFLKKAKTVVKQKNLSRTE